MATEEGDSLVQEKDDLRFQLNPHAKYDVRAAVLLIHDDQILVTLEATSGFAIVPGGAVKFGETVAEAAVREVYEELRLKDVQPSLVGVLESFWEQPEQTYQQLILVHRLELSSIQADAIVWQGGLQGQWLSFSEASKRLRPRALAQFLRSGETFLHLVDHHGE
ncbi:NUDIX hydrolase [Lacticaseibacillus chiayiensis]|uniref:NUDIX domain-containing protein n=1 Tax=Lacticaseibacillus chiayiensis TaxID=2100821 RepID=A0A4Q1U2Q8_9LACO|nr:NUDIX domain-containing protein [Lacticaseibacillus chiayiensis]QVI35989.1 NUDIX domain-containing protein [Lacticaseibacillus chiayiensis]RXT25025.1 NUDIX hydrolase [Lacticaseibacillus chiayiensis]UYN57788.1 NUDIX domain-containing protein [Lacticaseibacillus chiayiensis]